MAKPKRTNNELKNTTRTTKKRATRVNTGAITKKTHHTKAKKKKQKQKQKQKPNNKRRIRIIMSNITSL
jgi:hypothetical protein